MPEIQEQNVLLTLTTTSPNSQIRYTMDGNIPSIESNLYSSPIEVPYNTTVKSRTFRDGYVPSEVSVYTTKPVNFSIEEVPEAIKSILNGTSTFSSIYWNVYANGKYYIAFKNNVVKLYRYTNFKDSSTWEDCSSVFNTSSITSNNSFVYYNNNFYLLNNTTLYVANEENFSSNTQYTQRFSIKEASNNSNSSDYTSSTNLHSSLLVTNNRLLSFSLDKWYESGYVTGKYCLKVSEININSSNIESIIFDDHIPDPTDDYYHYEYCDSYFNNLYYFNGVYLFGAALPYTTTGQSVSTYIIYSTDLTSWKNFKLPYTQTNTYGSAYINLYISNGIIYTSCPYASYNYSKNIYLYYFDSTTLSFSQIKSLTQNNEGMSILNFKDFTLGTYSFDIYVSKNLGTFAEYSLNIEENRFSTLREIGGLDSLFAVNLDKELYLINCN